MYLTFDLCKTYVKLQQRSKLFQPQDFDEFIRHCTGRSLEGSQKHVTLRYLRFDLFSLSHMTSTASLVLDYYYYLYLFFILFFIYNLYPGSGSGYACSSPTASILHVVLVQISIVKMVMPS